MVEVPVATPVTTPEDDPTVATVVVELIHEPPLVASVSVIDDPAQTVLPPLIAAGAAVTVSIL
jgi:hypothetical protein